MATYVLTDPTTQARRHLGWTVVIGVFTALLGVFAFFQPVVAAVAAAVAFGAILFVRGIFGIAFAFETRHAGWLAVRVAAAALSVLVGLVALASPGMGILVLSLYVGASLVVSGAVGIGHGLRTRGTVGAGWSLAAGIISLLAGFLVWMGWPVDSPWVLGALVGFALLTDGIWMASLASTLRASLPPSGL